MKKFLSLVLALVMTMSLVTISAGAKDFTDDSKITYKEAVDVMSAVEVVDGYTDGSFQPTTALTRGAAAKIICNMILGPTTAEALIADAAPFKDVPADHVFAGYIAYCSQNGIINGYADGTFRPAGTLTGYAFMKMLLGALGYDGAIEGYTGANWSINVAKRALNLKLNDGNKAFVGSAAVTREEACLYAFNTLNTKMVEYPNNTTITVGDVNVTTTSKAVETVLFRAEYFDDLAKYTSVRTEAGRPAHTWKLDRDEIGTYADTADYVLVLDKDYEASDDALKIIRDLTDNDDLVWKYDGQKQVTKLYIDGANKSGDGAAALAAAKAGNVVEIFADKYDVIEDVVALTYKLAKIEKVSTTLTKAQKEDGATCKVTFENVGTFLDNEIVGFDADTYVKGAYVLVCKNADKDDDENAIIASQLAETVEGKVTAKKSGKVTIDGASYKDLTTAGIAIDDEGTFYLNLAGQIVLADTESKSDNYAYIYNVVKSDDRNADGVKSDVYTAYMVLTDGTKASYVIADKTENAALRSESYTGVIAFSINSDGELLKKDAKDTIATASLDVDKDDADGTLATTEFVFVYQKSGETKYTVKTATGYKSVDFAATAWTVTNSDGDVLFVFVPSANGSVDSDTTLAVVLDDAASETKNADGDVVYTYSVAIGDDNDATLTFKDEQSFKAGEVIAYVMDGDYAKIDSAATVLSDTKVDAANSAYFVANGTQYNLGTETVYTITMEYENEADYKADKVDTVTVSEDGTVEKDDSVVFTLKSGDLDIVFVYEFVY